MNFLLGRSAGRITTRDARDAVVQAGTASIEEDERGQRRTLPLLSKNEIRGDVASSNKQELRKKNLQSSSRKAIIFVSVFALSFVNAFTALSSPEEIISRTTMDIPEVLQNNTWYRYMVQQIVNETTNISEEQLEHPASAAEQSPVANLGEHEPITEPHKILQQYKAWHSVDTLRTESVAQLQQRRYAMAYYSCPWQAGNRLHHFMNSLMWGIITNRTVLYQYMDAPTCRYHQVVQTQIWHDPAVCDAANQLPDCDQVLLRAAWIPAYADWAPIMSWHTNISQQPQHVTIVDYWSVHSYSKVADWEQKRFPWLNTTNQTTTKVDEMTEQLVDFPEQVNKDATPSRPIQRQHVLATASAQERTAALFAEGTEFLFGMLFNDVFRFRFEHAEKHKTPNRPAEAALSFPPFSIAMHSRHRRGQDGSNVKKETECFDQILKLRQKTGNTLCHVCLMSDRPTTVEKLTGWLNDTYNCSVVTADLDTGNSGGSTSSFRQEHGPNAGVSFFRELDLCQHFYDGFIGTGGGSSSTALLEERMDYNRRMQQLEHASLNNETTTAPKPVHKCWL